MATNQTNQQPEIYTDEFSGRQYEYAEAHLDLEEWRRRKEEGEEFILPSGLPVRLKKVTMLDLATTHGDAVQTLIPTMEKLQSGTALSPSEYAEYAEVLRTVARHAIISPPLSMGLTPEPGKLSIEELDITDLMPIFEWTNEVGRLKKFRGR